MPHKDTAVSSIARHSREQGEPPRLSREEEEALRQESEGEPVQDQKALQRAKRKRKAADKFAGVSGKQKRKNDHRETNRGLKQIDIIAATLRALARRVLKVTER